MGAWEITKKDLWLMAKDRRALFLLLALPLAFVAILGASTGQLFTTRDETKLVKVGMVDQDGGESAERLVRDLQRAGGLKIDRAANLDEARHRLQDGRYNILVILGPEFQQRIDDLELGDVLDADHGKLSEGLRALDMHVESGSSFVNVAELVQYVVTSAALRAIAPAVAKKNKFAAQHIERILQRRREQYATEGDAPPRDPKVQTVSKGASIVYQQLVPSYTVMFAFFLVNIMAHSFIGERNIGTLRRLRMAPIRPVELLIGKTIPFYIVSVVQSLILFLSGKVLFGMSWGTYPAMLLAVIAATSVSATALGLLLSTIVRTDSQVSAYANFLVITLAGISGCFMPRDWLPQVMQQVSLATPHAWALIAYQQLLTWEHPNLPLVWQCCGALLSFGLVFFLIGCWRFRKLD